MKQGSIIVKYLLKTVALFDRKLYVPSMTHYSTIKYDDIVAYASKAAGIQEADMYAALSAIYDAFDYFICNGHSFKLDGVGTFSLALNAQAGLASSADTKTGAAAVRRVGINFLPDEKLKSLLANVAISVEADNQGQPEDPSPMLLSMGVDNDTYFDREHTTTQQLFLGSGKLWISGFNLDALGSVTIYNGTTSQVVALNVSDDGTMAEANIQGYIKTITVGETVYSFNAGTEDRRIVGDLYVDGKLFRSGGTLPLGKHSCVVKGYNLGDYCSVKFGNAVLEKSYQSNTRLEFDIDIAVASSTELEFTNIEGSLTPMTITVNSAAGLPANVQSITANGVEVLNGQSSQVIRGNTYHFVVLGWNLAHERYGGAISLPAGCVKSNYKYSPNRITFDMEVPSDAQSGQLKIGAYFTVDVSVVNYILPSVAVAKADTETTFAAATLLNGELANGGFAGTVDYSRCFVKIPNNDTHGITKDCFAFEGDGVEGTVIVHNVTTEPGVFYWNTGGGDVTVKIYEDSSKQSMVFSFTYYCNASPGE